MDEKRKKYSILLLLLIIGSLLFSVSFEKLIRINSLDVLLIALILPIFIILALNEVTIIENGYEKRYRFTVSVILISLLIGGKEVTIIATTIGMIICLILYSLKQRKIDTYDIIHKLASTIIPTALMCWTFVCFGGESYPELNFPIDFLLVIVASIINYLINTIIIISNLYFQDKKVDKVFYKIFHQEYGWILKYDIWQAIYAVLFYNTASLYLYGNFGESASDEFVDITSNDLLYFLFWIIVMIIIAYVPIKGWLTSFRTFILFNQQNVSNIIHNMQDGLLILNKDGTIKNMNVSAAEMFSSLFSIEKNRNFKEYIEKLEPHIKNGYKKKEQLISAMAGHSDSFRTDIEIKKPKDLYYNITITPEVNQYSEITGRVVTIENVTGYNKMINEINEKNKKLEEYRIELEKRLKELQETQDQLIISEKMAVIGQLVSGVAHEINTPLSSIKANVDMERKLLDGFKNRRSKVFTEIKEDVMTMNEVNLMALERIIEIVKGLKNFARLDEAEFKKINICEGLDNTVVLIKSQIGDNIKIIKEYNDIPEVFCSPQLINQVFLNLLVNAFHAIEGNGEIIIRTGKIEDRVFVSIIDTGCGIPKSKVARIFEPGYTTKGVGVGTGLGLSICYKIIQKHEGRILVKSEEGKGTEITVELPIQP